MHLLFRDVQEAAYPRKLIKECNIPQCAYDGGDCIQENIANGADLDPDKEYVPQWKVEAVHKAKQAYADYMLTRRFGGHTRLSHPHIPIMINKKVFTGKVVYFIH